MAREIGYFYYVSRSKIDMFGSGDFSGVEDNGYVYGWKNEEDNWILRAYLHTFEPNTLDAKAGLMIRELPNSNVAFAGLLLDGNGDLKVHRRIKTDGTAYTDESVSLGITQGLWLMIQKVGNTYYYRYSEDASTTNPDSVEWTTLAESLYDTTGWVPYQRELAVCSGDDFVNYAYFTNVFTEFCWISPIGQKED